MGWHEVLTGAASAPRLRAPNGTARRDHSETWPIAGSSSAHRAAASPHSGPARRAGGERSRRHGWNGGGGGSDRPGRGAAENSVEALARPPSARAASRQPHPSQSPSVAFSKVCVLPRKKHADGAVQPP
ncbi:unnamed protein product [Prorocentrum cordatum]|uniref:RNA helicase n=1 Tax=Prorocentrum cordatum TaxID=2364126 RepID=A0ABN9YDV0_9DINO|nr:unnamed protein product [Polarella glacialis]